ncbi:MAG: hypothetical protein MnENMB40S_25150 [Rhizobiaceae bacterium MnEN-MB40S]|nr:MAG: hypothetical protein MnENMB40S_25150 [Rhizobiaceae bacterium MnEN-MB40S]
MNYTAAWFSVPDNQKEKLSARMAEISLASRMVDWGRAQPDIKQVGRARRYEPISFG